MAEVLFVTMDGGGNVPPTLEVAAAVAARGHEVRVVGHRCLRGQVDAIGLRFDAFQSARRWDSTRAVGPLDWLPMLNDRGIGSDVGRICARDHPHVVVVDYMLPQALSVVQAAGIPSVVLTHTFRGYANGVHRIGAGSVARLRGHRIGTLWNAARLNLVMTVRWLDPASRRPQPDNVRWGGAAVPEVRPVRRDSPPLVLVSMSTNGFRGQDRTVGRVIRALSTLPVRAVVTTGGVLEREMLPAADNVDIVGYVDHGELMPRCALLVGHGGHATTFRALAHDIPVLFLPASRLSDQKLIADAIARAGAGLALSRSSSEEQIRHAVQTLLTEQEWPRAAARIGATIRGVDAAGAAADLIMETLEVE